MAYTVGFFVGSNACPFSNALSGQVQWTSTVLFSKSTLLKPTSSLSQTRKKIGQPSGPRCHRAACSRLPRDRAPTRSKEGLVVRRVLEPRTLHVPPVLALPTVHRSSGPRHSPTLSNPTIPQRSRPSARVVLSTGSSPGALAGVLCPRRTSGSYRSRRSYPLWLHLRLQPRRIRACTNWKVLSRTSNNCL